MKSLTETTHSEKLQLGYDQIKISANDMTDNLQCNTEFPIETEEQASILDLKTLNRGELI